ncbi:unnamed protein product [Effrenium voratum]|nr:unnamed protein product [Effrenium voratum]
MQARASDVRMRLPRSSARDSRASRSPSSSVRAFHHRGELPTKDVPEIVTDLLDGDSQRDDAMSAAMVLQCIEVVLTKIQRTPGRVLHLERLLAPVASAAARELQVGKQRRPHLLSVVEVNQERLQQHLAAQARSAERRSEQERSFRLLYEELDHRLEEAAQRRGHEEALLRSCGERLAELQQRRAEALEKRRQEQANRRALLHFTQEATLSHLATLRSSYDQEMQEIGQIKEEGALLAHQKSVALLEIADLPEMEDLASSLEAKRASLQEEMQMLLASSSGRNRASMAPQRKSTVRKSS